MQLGAQQQHPVRQMQRQAQQFVLGGVSVASHQGQERTPGGARELGADSLAWDSLAWAPFPCESASRLPRLAARTLREGRQGTMWHEQDSEERRGHRMGAACGTVRHSRDRMRGAAWPHAVTLEWKRCDYAYRGGRR